MDALFTDDANCSLDTLKRIVLLANRIVFVERPQLQLTENWGFFMRESQLKYSGTLITACGLDLKFISPPHGKPNQEFLDNLRKNWEDSSYRKLVFQALRDDESFAARYLPAESNFRVREGVQISGREIRYKILEDPTLIADRTEIEFDDNFEHDTERREGLLKCFWRVVLMASIQVELSLIASKMHSLDFISESPAFDKMLNYRLRSRASDEPAVGAAKLELGIASSVIPDELLQKIPLEQLLEYRLENKSYYAAYRIEMSRIQSQIETLNPEEVALALPSILAKDVAPLEHSFKSELTASRDKMFNNFLKNAAVTSFTTLYASQAYTMQTLAAGWLAAFGKAAWDYTDQTADVRRKNCLSYLFSIKSKQLNI